MAENKVDDFSKRQRRRAAQFSTATRNEKIRLNENAQADRIKTSAVVTAEFEGSWRVAVKNLKAHETALQKAQVAARRYNAAELQAEFTLAKAQVDRVTDADAIATMFQNALDSESREQQKAVCEIAASKAFELVSIGGLELSERARVNTLKGDMERHLESLENTDRVQKAQAAYQDAKADVINVRASMDYAGDLVDRSRYSHMVAAIEIDGDSYSGYEVNVIDESGSTRYPPGYIPIEETSEGIQKT